MAVWSSSIPNDNIEVFIIVQMTYTSVYILIKTPIIHFRVLSCTEVMKYTEYKMLSKTVTVILEKQQKKQALGLQQGTPLS